MMRIGLICPYDITKAGGVQEIVINLKNELIKRGHYVRIITPQPSSLDNLDINDILFIGESKNMRSPTHTTVQVGATNKLSKIEEILSKEQFDILHFHEPWVPVLSRQILQKSQSINVATFHAKVPETQLSRTVTKVFTPYLKSVLENIDIMTAVSNSAAEYAKSLTELEIKIIPNGINIKDYNLTRQPDNLDIPTILFIGRLERRKGVKYLIKAFALLQNKHPNVQLIIAGDGPGRNKLEDLVQSLGLNNVSFLGYISEKDKKILLAKSNLFCSPAIFGESFGIVLLEAMAAGIVTVAGNNSGYKEVLKDVGSLSLADPLQCQDFAQKLELFLYNQDLRKLWQHWAKDYIKQFSFTTIVDKYEALYSQALMDYTNSK